MIKKLNASDFFYLVAIEKRASKAVYKTFKINRHELNALVGLSAFLVLHNRKAVSRDVYTNKWLGLNFSLQKRYYAYLNGLVEKGCVYRLSYRRFDGNSLAISPYGLRILQAYEHALNQIIAKDKFKGDYKTVVFDPSDAVHGYKIMQHGRL